MLIELDSLPILLGLIKQHSKNSSAGKGRRHTVHSVIDLDTHAQVSGKTDPDARIGPHGVPSLET